MEQTSPEANDSTNTQAAAGSDESQPAAATRRRVSRRVSAPAGEAATSEAPATTAEADAETQKPAAKTTRRTSTRAASTRSTTKAASASSEGDANAAEISESAESTEAAAPKRQTRSRATKAASAKAQSTEAESTESQSTEAGESGDAAATNNAAEKAPARRSRARSTAKNATDAAAASDAAASTDSSGSSDADSAAETSDAKAAPKKRTSRTTKKAAAQAEPAEGQSAGGTDTDGSAAASNDSGDSGAADAASEGASDSESASTSTTRRRSPRGRGRSNAKADAESSSSDASADDADKSGGANDSASGEATEEGRSNGGNQQQRNGDTPARSSRTRQRERKRRQSDDLEPEIHEDDVLLPVAGILDVLDNYAFVRTSGYLPGTNDVYVSLGQVKKYGLRKGDAVVGAIRKPREGESSGRQKYNAIVKIDSVNSTPASEQQERADFADLTPLAPQEPLRLESSASAVVERMVDLFAPIGKGQRGIITGPARSGKSSLVERVAASVGAQHPDTHLMVVLIDERPEEVTRLQRSVNGEVVASTFERPVEDHITVAELAIERAKRLTELGHDVVVLFDSLSSLIRSYNLLGPASTRQPAGLIDAAAIVPAKRLLAAARNVENGGSLTILATAQTGAATDDVVLDELLGAVNLEVRLNGELAAQRQFPAIDLVATQTRRAEEIVGEAAAATIDAMRRALAPQGVLEAHAVVSKQLRESSSNVEFLTIAQRAYGSK